jgi:hypothetical protein
MIHMILKMNEGRYDPIIERVPVGLCQHEGRKTKPDRPLSIFAMWAKGET